MAEEELRTTGGEGLTIKGFYNLVLRATGSKATAEKAARERMAEMLRRGLTPE